jgi:hypothetical protein
VGQGTIIGGALLALASVLAGCGSDGPEDVAGPAVVEAGQLDIQLPPGWKLTEGGAERPAAAAPAADGSTAGASGAETATGDTVPLAEEDPSTAFFAATGRFRQCLEDLGTEFQGAPDPWNPSSPSNDPSYVEDLSTCAAKSGIVQAMQGMQQSQAELTPEEIEEQNEGFLDWRDCMIERGWKISEPKPDSEGRLFSFGGGGGSGLQIEAPAGEDLMGSEDMQACTEEAQ